MSWHTYAKHDCGHITYVPANNVAFLTGFSTLCENCGGRWKSYPETFVAREVWKPKWYNPFFVEFEIRKEDLK